MGEPPSSRGGAIVTRADEPSGAASGASGVPGLLKVTAFEDGLPPINRAAEVTEKESLYTREEPSPPTSTAVSLRYVKSQDDGS